MSWVHCTSLACEGGCKEDYDVEGSELHARSMWGVERQPTRETSDNHKKTGLPDLEKVLLRNKGQRQPVKLHLACVVKVLETKRKHIDTSSKW